MSHFSEEADSVHYHIYFDDIPVDIANIDNVCKIDCNTELISHKYEGVTDTLTYLQYLNTAKQVILSYISTLSNNYMWNETPFNLAVWNPDQMPTYATSKEDHELTLVEDDFSSQLLNQHTASINKYKTNKPTKAPKSHSFPTVPHLFGSVKYLDCVNDQWFVVYLLLRISARFPFLTIRVTEAYQHFILAYCPNTPSWLDHPNRVRYRVWIRGGQVMIIPRPSPSLDIPSSLTVCHALHYVRTYSQRCLVNSGLTRSLLFPLLTAPRALLVENNVVIQLLLPLSVCYLLAAYPYSLQLAVDALIEASSPGSVHDKVTIMRRFILGESQGDLDRVSLQNIVSTTTLIDTSNFEKQYKIPNTPVKDTTRPKKMPFLLFSVRMSQLTAATMQRLSITPHTHYFSQLPPSLPPSALRRGGNSGVGVGVGLDNMQEYDGCVSEEDKHTAYSNYILHSTSADRNTPVCSINADVDWEQAVMWGARVSLGFEMVYNTGCRARVKNMNRKKRDKATKENSDISNISDISSIDLQRINNATRKYLESRTGSSPSMSDRPESTHSHTTETVSVDPCPVISELADVLNSVPACPLATDAFQYIINENKLNKLKTGFDEEEAKATVMNKITSDLIADNTGFSRDVSVSMSSSLSNTHPSTSAAYYMRRQMELNDQHHQHPQNNLSQASPPSPHSTDNIGSLLSIHRQYKPLTGGNQLSSHPFSSIPFTDAESCGRSDTVGWSSELFAHIVEEVLDCNELIPVHFNSPQLPDSRMGDDIDVSTTNNTDMLTNDMLIDSANAWSCLPLILPTRPLTVFTSSECLTGSETVSGIESENQSATVSQNESQTVNCSVSVPLYPPRHVLPSNPHMWMLLPILSSPTPSTIDHTKSHSISHTLSPYSPYSLPTLSPSLHGVQALYGMGWYNNILKSYHLGNSIANNNIVSRFNCLLDHSTQWRNTQVNTYLNHSNQNSINPDTLPYSVVHTLLSCYKHDISPAYAAHVVAEEKSFRLQHGYDMTDTETWQRLNTYLYMSEDLHSLVFPPAKDGDSTKTTAKVQEYTDSDNVVDVPRDRVTNVEDKPSQVINVINDISISFKSDTPRKPLVSETTPSNTQSWLNEKPIFNYEGAQGEIKESLEAFKNQFKSSDRRLGGYCVQDSSGVLDSREPTLTDGPDEHSIPPPPLSNSDLENDHGDEDTDEDEDDDDHKNEVSVLKVLNSEDVNQLSSRLGQFMEEESGLDGIVFHPQPSGQKPSSTKETNSKSSTVSKRVATEHKRIINNLINNTDLKLHTSKGDKGYRTRMDAGDLGDISDIEIDALFRSSMTGKHLFVPSELQGDPDLMNLWTMLSVAGVGDDAKIQETLSKEYKKKIRAEQATSTSTSTSTSGKHSLHNETMLNPDYLLDSDDDIELSEGESDIDELDYDPHHHHPHQGLFNSKVGRLHENMDLINSRMKRDKTLADGENLINSSKLATSSTSVKPQSISISQSKSSVKRLKSTSSSLSIGSEDKSSNRRTIEVVDEDHNPVSAQTYTSTKNNNVGSDMKRKRTLPRTVLREYKDEEDNDGEDNDEDIDDIPEPYPHLTMNDITRSLKTIYGDTQTRVSHTNSDINEDGEVDSVEDTTISLSDYMLAMDMELNKAFKSSNKEDHEDDIEDDLDYDDMFLEDDSHSKHFKVSETSGVMEDIFKSYHEEARLGVVGPMTAMLETMGVEIGKESEIEEANNDSDKE